MGSWMMRTDIEEPLYMSFKDKISSELCLQTGRDTPTFPLFYLTFGLFDYWQKFVSKQCNAEH